MSASLVGSEMCIRDRVLTCNVQSPTRKFESQALDPQVRVASLGSNPDTVSYTHLTLPTICSV
eukprot:12238976-Alexandrium_andersonii.AAC.1